MRQSIQPTYDSRDTGPRFTVESRLNDQRIAHEAIPDPFVFHRVTIGWRDLLRFVFGGRRIEVVVGGDSEIVEDVSELDDNYTGRHDSTRKAEWNKQIQDGLAAFASPDKPGGSQGGAG